MIVNDKIEEYKGCVIQHGHYNNRIYLMKIISHPQKDIAYELISFAKKNGYSKIFAKVPENISEAFLNAGFCKEAIIPSFFYGKESVLFMGFYLNKERYKETNLSEMKNILDISLKQKSEKSKHQNYCKKFVIRKCNEKDVHYMADLYRKVFPSYPFPIYNPKYLLRAMKAHVDYFGIEVNNTLVALAAAEIDEKNLNAEMTDFAVLPEYRGNDFAFYLLMNIELEMKKKSILTTYTIARAMSYGINITFSKAGYQFGGRLKNNTNISGRVESMNVWYKFLY